MTIPIGSAVPIGLPGGTTGYFQVLRPTFDKFDIPGVELHPNVLTALAAGTATLKYGTLIGRDKTDAIASGISQARYKIVTDNAPNAWEVLDTNVVGGIHPIQNNGYDPGVQGSGRIAIPFTSWYDAQTANVLSFTGLAVGNYLVSAPGGVLQKSTTSGKIVVAVVEEVILGAQGFNGSDLQNVVTCRFLGTASGTLNVIP